MTKSFFLLAVLCFVVTTSAFAGVFTGAQAISRPDGIYVQWWADDESGVVGYKVQRKAGTATQYDPVMTNLIPVRSDRSYEYIDLTAFKTTDNFYQYRVIAVDSRGGEVGHADVSIIHSSVSSVRRTWGSIKAMFR
jgi:hypothetical protein